MIFFLKKKDDAYWWQARKEVERTSRAGLIPSRALQERRIIHERTQAEASGDSKSKLTMNCRLEHIITNYFTYINKSLKIVI